MKSAREDRVRRHGFLAIALLGVIAHASCVNLSIRRPYERDLDADFSAAPEGDASKLEYAREPLPLQNHDHELRGPYAHKTLTFPSIGENGQDDNLVTVRYYKSRLPGKKGLVIVLPIWGGKHEYPARKITRGLLRHRDGLTNVIRLMSDGYLLDWPAVGRAADEGEFTREAERNAERLRTMVIDLRRLLDWVDTQPDIDKEQVTVLGFSVSAVIAGGLAKLDERISSAVLIMGAARPHELMAHCPGRPGAARDAVLERFGWSVEEYQARMKGIFGFLDPETLPGKIDPARVLVFDSYVDECMPRSSRDALWNTLGRPERYSFFYTHKRSFLAMTPLGGNYINKRIYDFIDRIGS